MGSRDNKPATDIHARLKERSPQQHRHHEPAVAGSPPPSATFWPTPPADVREALLGVDPPDLGMFVAWVRTQVIDAEQWGHQLSARGWAFDPVSSGENAVGWTFEPSRIPHARVDTDYGEPVTTVLVSLDKVERLTDGLVEVVMVGDRLEAGAYTGTVAEFVAHLPAFEAYRPGERVESLPLPYTDQRTRLPFRPRTWAPPARL